MSLNRINSQPSEKKMKLKILKTPKKLENQTVMVCLNALENTKNRRKKIPRILKRDEEKALISCN